MTSLPPPDGDPYDFAMVGAGAAGLCLALRLGDAFPDARILLVDPGFAACSCGSCAASRIG